MNNYKYITLGIHDGHNASVALMGDGEIIYAIQEERLVKEKNRGGFPKNALKETLLRNKLSIDDINKFVFVGRSATRSMGFYNRDNILKKYKELFSKDINRRKNILIPVKNKIKNIFSISSIKSENSFYRIPNLSTMGVQEDKIIFIDHHLCHAAAAAYGWGLKERLAVVTSDAAGDGISGSVSVYDGEKLVKVNDIKVSDSIAKLYALTTYYLGMVPMEHEYKIMGMSPYSENSEPAREIADYFHSLFEFSTAEKGCVSYSLKKGVQSVKEMGPRLFDFYRFKRFDQICAGLQLFIEEFASEWLSRVLNSLKINKVALSGGLFMNVKLNKRISELSEVEDIYIFPSCGDESNVFGALYEDYYRYTGKQPKLLKDYYLGGDFSDDEIERAVKNYNFRNSLEFIRKESCIEQGVAELLAKNEIVARFYGRMEFGARALGNRSILANPSDPNCVKVINKMIKSRDFWMPFAPSMIDIGRYVENPKNISSPYMILAYKAREDKTEFLRSVIHPYDETCRPQEVYREWNPEYFSLIEKFEELTGESAILNTSFNLHGFPLVYTPQDALNVFDNSGLKYLAIGRFLLKKS